MERIKRPLRPWVRSGRRLWERLERRVRGEQPWDGRHHPVFELFPPWRGEVDGRFLHDSLGVRTDPCFRAGFEPQPRGFLQTRHPRPHAGYFELVFVLESVAEAREAESFTVVELGAGYGPWLVTAHRAMRSLAETPVRLIGVEMVPHHFAWMEQHLRDNGIDPAGHRLIHAAVSDHEGHGSFREESDRNADFGQSLRRRETGPGEAGRGVVRVPVVSLRGLLRELERVDLLHLDVQGEERRVVPHAIDELNRKVRRLIYATHSRRTERELRRLLRSHGWQPVFDYGLRRRERTPFGDVQFLDGLQAWLNSRR